jgi:hypothetical protein
MANSRDDVLKALKVCSQSFLELERLLQGIPPEHLNQHVIELVQKGKIHGGKNKLHYTIPAEVEQAMVRIVNQLSIDSELTETQLLKTVLSKKTLRSALELLELRKRIVRKNKSFLLLPNN